MKTQQDHVPPYTALLALYNKARGYPAGFIETKFVEKCKYKQFKYESWQARLTSALTFVDLTAVLGFVACVSFALTHRESVVAFYAQMSMLTLCLLLLLSHGSIALWYWLKSYRLNRAVEWSKIEEVSEVCQIFETVYEHSGKVLPEMAEEMSVMIVNDARETVRKIKSFNMVGAPFLEAGILAAEEARQRCLFDLIDHLDLIPGIVKRRLPHHFGTTLYINEQAQALAKKRRMTLLYESLYKEID